MLEQFAEGCARVASDPGDENPQSDREPTTSYPELELNSVTGDWRTLPAMKMYRIRELPVLRSEALRTIADAGENSFPPGYSEYYWARQYQFARLGIKAVILAMRLRKAVRLPETRLTDNEWSAMSVLWKVWRRERHRRAKEFIENREWHEPVQPPGQ